MIFHIQFSDDGRVNDIVKLSQKTCNPDIVKDSAHSQNGEKTKLC